MTEPAFKKHQYELTAHLRDPENNPAPEGVEDRRLDIYAYRAIQTKSGQDLPANIRELSLVTLRGSAVAIAGIQRRVERVVVAESVANIGMSS